MYKLTQEELKKAEQSARSEYKRVLETTRKLGKLPIKEVHNQLETAPLVIKTLTWSLLQASRHEIRLNPLTLCYEPVRHNIATRNKLV